jgi:hypothetical protein
MYEYYFCEKNSYPSYCPHVVDLVVENRGYHAVSLWSLVVLLFLNPTLPTLAKAETSDFRGCACFATGQSP